MKKVIMFKNFNLILLKTVLILNLSSSLFALNLKDQTILLNAYIHNIERCLIESDCTLKNLHEEEKLLKFFINIRAKELEYLDKYQVITAQDSYFFAYQVIAKELYQRLQKKNVTDFEYLRAPHESLAKNREDFFKQYPSFNVSKETWAQIAGVPVENLLDFLEQNEQDDDSESDDEDEKTNKQLVEQIYAITDTCPEISRQLIAGNLSIETYAPADSAFDVFMDGIGIVTSQDTNSEEAYFEKLKSHLIEMFDHAGLSRASYAPYLDGLIQVAPKTQQGIITQIFLPKNHIEDFLYIAFPFGLLNSIEDEIIHQVFATFQSNRLKPNFNINKNLQVRIIAGSLFNDEVKIFRHTLIPQTEQDAYLQYVENTIEQILLHEEM